MSPSADTRAAQWWQGLDDRAFTPRAALGEFMSFHLRGYRFVVYSI